MYKVIIVDDEKIIRDGLQKFVPWNELGYDVAATFEDGKDAINFIDSNKIDLVITDIMMNDISGIELSKHIHENHPNIVICIISGYKDFDYAQQAIKYNVKRFLTKPTDIPEVIETVKEIKKQLDAKSFTAISYDKLLTKARHQFFSNLFMGIYPNIESVISEAQTLNLQDHSFACAFFWLTVNNYKNFKTTTWNYSQNTIYTAIHNFLKNDNGIFFQNLIIVEGKLMILALQYTNNCDIFETQLRSIITEMQNNLNNILHLNITIQYGTIFDTISKVVKYVQLPLLSSKTILTEEKDILLREKYKNIVLAITLNDLEILENNFEIIKIILASVSTEELNEVLINFLTTIFDAISSSTNYKNLKNVYRADLRIMTTESKRQSKFNLCFGILADLCTRTATEMSSENLIERALEFISLHYKNDISLEEVANYVFLNPAYFSRYFKKHTGHSYVNYLTNFRINKAIELMKNGNYKIMEIARMVGYNSDKYFARQFKELTGLTPSDYVRNELENNNE